MATTSSASMGAENVSNAASVVAAMLPDLIGIAIPLTK